MTQRDLFLHMWVEACQRLDRADRLSRRFFEPAAAGTATWEPPVDVFETDARLLVEVALPGVDPRSVVVGFEGGVLAVSGERRLPRLAGGATIRRLELPYGRFERRVALPAGSYELVSRDMVNGCLLLTLRRVG